jgi:hypothetical protein
MIRDHEGRQGHDRFRELGALAASGVLTPSERSELKSHLLSCEECREVRAQYVVLSQEGIPALAAFYAKGLESESWDDAPIRRKLFARMRADANESLFELHGGPQSVVNPFGLRRIAARPTLRAALAACLIVTVGLGCYRLGSRSQQSAMVRASGAPQEDPFRRLAAEKESVDQLLAAQTRRLTQLQEQSLQKEEELEKSRSALRALGDHANALTVANSQSQEQLSNVSQQRDALNARLQNAEQDYQGVQAELADLRAERDKTLQRTTSLEARIEELSSVNLDQERRLKDTEQYLASDRDIRELMGARKLYIADVFDVDGTSRTKKPFGRVFYTQGKSLIFYAFDLDRQPGIVNASTFQVWGQKETAQGERALPLNLGILYMDNESNRRWVMRFDDPKQLAEIDAVFVTVEPRGGSLKPTSKPLLYALLRNEVNHP